MPWWSEERAFPWFIDTVEEGMALSSEYTFLHALFMPGTAQTAALWPGVDEGRTLDGFEI